VSLKKSRILFSRLVGDFESTALHKQVMPFPVQRTDIALVRRPRVCAKKASNHAVLPLPRFVGWKSNSYENAGSQRRGSFFMVPRMCSALRYSSVLAIYCSAADTSAKGS
jgi:hypothetical protein